MTPLYVLILLHLIFGVNTFNKRRDCRDQFLAICGICLIVKQDAPGKVFLTPAQWKAAGKLFCVYLAFVLLFWLFGFVVAVPVILFVITFMLSGLSAKDAGIKKRLLMSLIFAVVGGAVLYLAYVVGLGARMPKGLILKLLK